MTSPRPLVAALTLAAAAFALTGCAASADPGPGGAETTAPTPSASTPAPSATPTDAPVDAEPTCETIVPESIVADFESLGWSAQADRFYIGDLEVPDGLLCVWADFEAPAGDHLQLFGWAPIEESVAQEAQDSLLAQGWRREDAPGGVYITEPAETTIQVDDEGYGMTYLFVDGAVELADTKQGLLLIEWPRG
ncbi:hypothetical protein [Microbacterium sp. NPDC055357]